MPMPPVSDAARERFDALVASLQDAGRDVERTQMFGMPSAKVVGGRTFMGLYGDDLAVKLGAAAHARAMEVDDAGPFDPSGGRPMREWVSLPAASRDRWAEFAAEAADHVAGLG